MIKAKLYKVWIWVRRSVLALIVIGILGVMLGRVMLPPFTHTIAVEWLRLGDVERQWIDIEDLPAHVPLTIMGAEDANFCLHNGFDFDAIRAAMAEEGRRRGASTLSQQVAKNVYLWQRASWLRKGLEAGVTVLIEISWPKHRIMEAYLNVAEMGEGVFGIEAAAQHWFGVSADNLTAAQAARIAAILPNPKVRSANVPSEYVAGRARAAAAGGRTLAQDGRGSCVMR